MDPVSLLIPAALAFLAGLLCLGYLVVPPLHMSSYLLYASLMVFTTGFAIYSGFWGSWTEMLISAGLSVIAFLGGYVVMTAKVLASDESLVIPPIKRRKDDVGLGHTAVVSHSPSQDPYMTRRRCTGRSWNEPTQFSRGHRRRGLASY